MSPERKKRSRRLAINIILSVLFAAMVLSNKYPQRIYNRINAFLCGKRKDNGGHDYRSNQNYTEQTGFYGLYNGTKNIAMLGNSLTYRVDWGELLDRSDVANRGIGCDVTEGFLNRLQAIYLLQPKICFIEGGSNDLSYKIAPDTIVSNLGRLTDSLRSRHIIPVLMAVTPVKASYPNKMLNAQISLLNCKVRFLATERHIDLIDLNPYISCGGALKDDCAIADGIHLSSKAYALWKEAVLSILRKYNI